MKSDPTIGRDLDYVTIADRPNNSVHQINDLLRTINALRREISDLRRKNERQRNWMLKAEHLKDCFGSECDCNLDDLLNDREQTDFH